MKYAGKKNVFSSSILMLFYIQVHVVGPQNVLHKYEPFLLNPPISLLLYLLR